MLELKNYSVYIKEKKLVGPVSLKLPLGHLLAITGPNGSGKSTLLRGMLGLLETQGTLKYNHRKLDRLPAGVIGYVPQRFHFQGTLPLTVDEFFNLSAVVQPDEELCHRLKIGDLGSKSMSVLSGGEIQRVVLARALARQPQLLVLDEASAGIDVSGRAEIADLLEHLVTDHELTVISVTHDQAELSHYKKLMKRKYHELTLAGHSN